MVGAVGFEPTTSTVLRELRVLRDWAHDYRMRRCVLQASVPGWLYQLGVGRCFGDLRRHGASSDQRQGWPSGGLLARSASGVAPGYDRGGWGTSCSLGIGLLSVVWVMISLLLSERGGAAAFKIQHSPGKSGSAGPECSLLTTEVTNSGNSCRRRLTHRPSGRLGRWTRVVPAWPRHATGQM